MKLFVLILALFQTVVAYGKQIRIDIRVLESHNRAIIQGDSCNEVTQLMKEISVWKEARDPKDLNCKLSLSAHTISHLEPKSSTCEFDITDCLPNSIRELIEVRTSKFDGPQCFNTALIASGITPALRTIGYNLNSSESEINAMINSSLCQKVSFVDRKIGDIGLFKLKQGTFRPQSNHALVYIGHGLTFSKANITRNSVFDFKTISEEAEEQRFFKTNIEKKLRN